VLFVYILEDTAAFVLVSFQVKLRLICFKFLIVPPTVMAAAGAAFWLTSSAYEHAK
jgi:hypothetical protein